MTCPAAERGSTQPFAIELSWRDPRSEVVHTRTACVDLLHFDDPRQVKEQPRDHRLARTVVTHWHADIVLRVTELNRMGDYQEASSYLEQQLHYLRRYCRGLEGTQHILYEVERLWRESHRDWGERTRKELYTSSYHASKGTRDYRSRRKLSDSPFM